MGAPAEMMELLGDFLAEAGDLLDDVDRRLVELEKTPGDSELLNTVFRGFHTIKGGAGFLEATALVNLCHKTENLFDKLRSGKMTLSAELMDTILAATGEVRRMFGEMAGGAEPAPADPAILEALAAALEGRAVKRAAVACAPAPAAVPAGTIDWQRLYEAIVPGSTPTPTPAQAPAPAAAVAPRAAPVAADAAIRVETSRFDQILNLTGEVGLTKNRIACLRTALMNGAAEGSDTASTLPIIGLGAVERALKVRRGRPMLMIDLAVPRDIEPEVARLPEVSLYTVDDLSTLVQSAGAKRHAAVEQAEAIVEAGVRRFAHWLEQRATVPLIKALQAQADDWRATELARARRSLLRGETVDAVLEKLSRGIAQKMLHGAMAGLRASAGEHRAQLEGTVSRLFLGCPVRNPIDVPAAPALCAAQTVAGERATRPVLRAVNGGRRST